MKIVIYGAQGIALGAYKSIKILFPDQVVVCFLVTEMAKNAPTLAGIPVLELKEFVSEMKQEDKNEIQVLISTPETVMGAIEKNLENVGLLNHIRLDSVRWAKLQEMAFLKTGEYVPLSAYAVGNNRPIIHMYEMVHEKDKQIQREYFQPEYMIKLQVGAKLSDKKMALLSDGCGDNISDKNGNYSELTGLYWVWKQQIIHEKKVENTYYGLSHYRRMLEFSEEDLNRILTNSIDVVLPYPMPYEPNIEAHHKRYLNDNEWNAVLQALQELQPDYFENFMKIMKQNYLYNYNVILAKARVLDDYCNWLFPLLFRIEQINDPKGNKEPNRFIGYVGETLETLYFMSNNRLKIAHTGCRFLV